MDTVGECATTTPTGGLQGLVGTRNQALQRLSYVCHPARSTFANNISNGTETYAKAETPTE